MQYTVYLYVPSTTLLLTTSSFLSFSIAKAFPLSLCLHPSSIHIHPSIVPSLLSCLSMADSSTTTTTRNNSGAGGGGGLRVSQDPALKAGTALSDERVDFLREQAFCVLRVKTDKWNRFIGAEENQKILLDFLDHIWSDRLILFTGPGGTLHAGDVQVSSR